MWTLTGNAPRTMGRLSLALSLLLVASLSVGATNALAAPKHDRAIFRARFLQRYGGQYFGMQLGTGSWWKTAGESRGGELQFKNDVSGKFDVREVSGEDGGSEKQTDSKLLGTGRAYVTKTTITLVFKSTSSSSLKKAMKYLSSGTTYYYRVKSPPSGGGVGWLSLYKSKADWTKGRILKKLPLGQWG